MLGSCPEPSKASTSPHRNSFIFRVSNFHAFFGSPVFLNHQNLILPKFHIFEILGCSSPHQILMFPLISHLFEVLEQASSHHHSPTFYLKNHHFPACASSHFRLRKAFFPRSSDWGSACGTLPHRCGSSYRFRWHRNSKKNQVESFRKRSGNTSVVL